MPTCFVLRPADVMCTTVYCVRLLSSRDVLEVCSPVSLITLTLTLLLYFFVEIHQNRPRPLSDGKMLCCVLMNSDRSLQNKYGSQIRENWKFFREHVNSL